MILEQILALKRIEVARRKREVDLAQLRTEARRQSPAVAASSSGALSAGSRGRFATALRQPGVSLIAEAKQRSPSGGILRGDYQPADLALTYVENGAAAVSVLTDEQYFGGSLRHIGSVAGALRDHGHTAPVLRKDFIVDEYQVYETRLAGADALLLIVAALEDESLVALLELAHSLGMDALVETHDGGEIGRALAAGAEVIGVNNRDLRDFSVDLATFGRLRESIPADVVAVAESGVHDASDVSRLRDMGADAVLVGTALVTADDPGAKVRELVGGGGP